jgi:lactoylglutathione lyase
MKLAHFALWARDIDALKTFYETYFGARANDKYVNPKKGFSSYFLTFEGDARLELMQRPDVTALAGGEQLGYAHLAIAVGSDAAVDALTARLRSDGHPIVDGPRRTGDGYYESVALDPEGNRIEITA